MRGLVGACSWEGAPVVEKVVEGARLLQRPGDIIDVTTMCPGAESANHFRVFSDGTFSTEDNKSLGIPTVALGRVYSSDSLIAPSITTGSNEDFIQVSTLDRYSRHHLEIDYAEYIRMLMRGSNGLGQVALRTHTERNVASRIMATGYEVAATSDPQRKSSLTMGRLGKNSMVFATERPLLQAMGAARRTDRDILPGEIVTVDVRGYDGFQSTRVGSDINREMSRGACSLLYAGGAIPNGLILGKRPGVVSRAMGTLLANEHPIDNAKAVLFNADEEDPYVARGYARGSGIQVSARAKLVDDSFVSRGKFVLVNGAMKTAEVGKVRMQVQSLLARGADEVHVRIGAPLITESCPSGIRNGNDGQSGPDQSTLPKEIKDWLGADSIGFLSKKSFEWAIAGGSSLWPLGKICTACMPDVAS